MVEHVHKTYSCDRCGVDVGAKRPQHLHNVSVSASFHYNEGPGPSFVWKDLCASCYEEVKAFFKVTY